jgi:serine/threonine protein kinase
MRCLQLPLYKAATKDDLIYKFIYQKDYDAFWDHFEGNYYGKGFFSDNFKNLLSRMLAYDPQDRLSLE